MTPLKIGAALKTAEIAQHRDWLFDAGRDIELQDFMSLEALTTGADDRIAAAKAALDGFTGRLGIHGPFEGLDIDNKDPELRPLITRRFITAVEVAARLGARQVVIHSPFNRWTENNLHCWPGYAASRFARIEATLTPVIAAAEREGVTLVVENIQDVRPETRREMVEAFGSDALALSIDTGHAHLARRMSGAPPVDFFVADAGDRLAHVHLQDVDGHADRHWAPGEGEIEWAAVFRALGRCGSAPHLVLELRDKADIPAGFGWLEFHGLVC